MIYIRVVWKRKKVVRGLRVAKGKLITVQYASNVLECVGIKQSLALEHNVKNRIVK